MGISLKKLGAFAVSPLVGVGSIAKDHIDDAGKDMPAYNAPELDADTKGMMQSQVERANQSDREMLAAKMAGVDQGSAMIDPSAIQQQNRSLGMAGDTAMDQALSKRSSQYFDRAQGKVRGAAESGLAAERFNRRQQALQNKTALDAQEEQIRQRKVQHEANVKAAKNQAMADILGLGGMAVGGAAGAMAGGPKGAAKGAKIGGSMSAFAGNTEMRGMGNG